MDLERDLLWPPIQSSIRHAILKHLKTNNNYYAYSISPNLTVDNKDFDVLEKRSKDYYDFFYKI